MRLRKPIHGLADQEARQLVAAFDALKSSPDPTRSYAYWASVHGCCGQHLSAMFLPWHRAFIFAFEDALRSAIGDNSLTLPYWDWIALPRLPDLLQDPVFTVERYTDVQRAANHLELPSAERVRKAVEELDQFADFGGYYTSAGELESIHGYPHTWVGPWMHVRKFSAFDPVFWFHHSNVDRLWAVWQTKWPGQDPPCLDDALIGVPGGWHVRDVLHITSARLDYQYVSDAASIFGERVVVTKTGLALTIPVPVDGRVELHFGGVRSTSTAPGPTELLVFLGGQEQPAGRFSLFGVTGARATQDPDIIPIPECPPEDHDHHEASFRLNLTDALAGTRGGSVQVRLATSGGPPGETGVSIERISIVGVIV